MPIRCVTFDLDDTLWDIGPVVDRAESEFYTWLQSGYPEVTRRFELNTLAEHRRTFYTRHPHKQHDFTWLRRQWLHHIAQEHGYDESFVDDAFEVYFAHRNSVELFADAQPTLERIASRYKTGVITNGNACVIRIGIAHHFQFIVSAESAGAAKPQARIFEAAIAAAGVPAEQIAHIGDDPERDIKGARRLGMKTIWYNAHGARWPGGPPPDLSVRTLAELEPALADL
ncbi:MAG: HAD family hydrolase [Gammaproteobacteria bacterium]|nr:HAD family hydrolase [Gammaproteobacteria bacterium]